MNHECCNETCPLTSCQMASPLCTADADTRFAVQRYDRQVREEAERKEALLAKRAADKKAAFDRGREISIARYQMGFKKYDKRRKFAKV